MGNECCEEMFKKIFEKWNNIGGVSFTGYEIRELAEEFAIQIE